MGKTIRRKGSDSHGAYDWKDDERQRHGAGKKYYHSDAACRNGRAATVDPEAKVQASQVRRSEAQNIAYQSLYGSEDDFIPHDDKHAQSKSNEHWHFS